MQTAPFNRRTLLRTAAALPGSLLAQPEAIYLQDFRRARPEAALTDKSMHGRWRLIRYESDLGPGYMLAAGHNTMAPQIEVPLDRRGWHAVYLGLRSAYGESRLQARLKSDKTFTLITQHDMVGMRLERRDIEVRGGTQFSTGPRVEELFWKCAQLNGESLILRQLSVENVCSPVWVAYIKLVPLTEAEVRSLEDERQSGVHKRLYAHNDAFGSPSWLRFTTADEIRREVEPYRHTDFSRMY